MSKQYKFTTCGQKGRLGPTDEMIQKAYQGTDLEGKVTAANGLQIFTVPLTGDYRITAVGARGGNGNPGSYTDGGECGGFGASMSGKFRLTAGEKLVMLVGQKGGDFAETGYRDGTSGSGGGGTFVTKQASEQHNTQAEALADKYLDSDPKFWTSPGPYYYVRSYGDGTYWVVPFMDINIPDKLEITKDQCLNITLVFDNDSPHGVELSQINPWKFQRTVSMSTPSTIYIGGSGKFVYTNCKPLADALASVGKPVEMFIDALPRNLRLQQNKYSFLPIALPEFTDARKYVTMSAWQKIEQFYLICKRQSGDYYFVLFDNYTLGDPSKDTDSTVMMYLSDHGNNNCAMVEYEVSSGSLTTGDYTIDMRTINVEAPREYLFSNCKPLIERIKKTRAGQNFQYYQPENLVHLEPLLIAGGGNGGPDRGYSGNMTIYHAQTTVGSNPGTTNCAGGGYRFGATGKNTVGYAFTSGGMGAGQWTSRNGTSEPGFGGGGSNTDDGNGGGGGGYYGGARDSYGASSFNAGIDQINTAKVGTDDGYIVVELLAVKKFVLLDGEIIKTPTLVGDETTWVEVGKAPITTEIIQQHGVLEIPNTIKGIVSEHPKIYGWTDTTEAIPQKVAIAYARDNAVLIMEKDILYTDYNITDMLKLMLKTTKNEQGDLRCLTSIDSGKTWKSFHGEQWIDVDITNIDDFWSLGMSAATLEQLTPSQIAYLEHSAFRIAILGRIQTKQDTLSVQSLQMQFTIAE